MNTESENPNYTSDFVSYHVARNGRHYLRTEQNVMGYDLPRDIEATLAAKFPASEGYKLSREVKPNSGRSYAVNNGSEG
jgi:hypothetical protein